MFLVRVELGEIPFEGIVPSVSRTEKIFRTKEFRLNSPD